MSAEPLDLGHGHTASFTCWAPDRELNPQFAGLPDVDPWGVIVDHSRPDGTPCIGGAATFDGPVVRQTDPNRQLWTVESLDPLTISPSLLCGSCGDHGFIRDGRWVPT
jgi:hypothetical protein